MRKLLALLLFSGCCTVSHAQQAIVVGPTQSDPGDLIILDASTSVGSGHTWILANSNKAWLAFEDGQKLVFSSGASGEFVFILGVADQGRVSLAKHVVTIGGPAPKPVDPVKPDEPVKPVDPVIPPQPVLSAIATGSRDAAIRCERQPGETALLADHFEAVASKAAALNWTMEQMAGELKKSFLGSNPDAARRWSPYNAWIKTIGPSWSSPAKVSEDLFEMSKGLRSIDVQKAVGSLPKTTLGSSAADIRERLEELNRQVGEVP